MRVIQVQLLFFIEYICNIISGRPRDALCATVLLEECAKFTYNYS